jgi:hypothetical protein
MPITALNPILDSRSCENARAEKVERVGHSDKGITAWSINGTGGGILSE